MAKKVRKTTVTRVGSTHKGGKTGLAFKKGTKNYTETEIKKTSTKRYKMGDDRKKFTGAKQRPNESATAYYKRTKAKKK